MSFVSLYLYVPDEGSLLPKYRDCTTSNDFELYIYIYIYIYIARVSVCILYSLYICWTHMVVVFIVMVMVSLLLDANHYWLT